MYYVTKCEVLIAFKNESHKKAYQNSILTNLESHSAALDCALACTQHVSTLKQQPGIKIEMISNHFKDTPGQKVQEFRKRCEKIIKLSVINLPHVDVQFAFL